MPESSLQRAVTEIQAGYRVLGGVDLSDWLALRPEDDRRGYVEVLSRQDWVRLEQVAKDRKATYDAAGRGLLRHRADLLEQFALNQRAEAVFEETFVPPRSRADWPELRSGIERELRRRRVPPRRVAAFIGALAQQDKTTVPRAHRNALRKREELLDDVAELSLAGLMGAHLALAVAQFNRAVRSSRQSLDDVPAFVAQTVAGIETEQRSWYGALRAGAFPALSWRPDAASMQRLSRAAALAGVVARARHTSPHDRDLGGSALALGGVLRALLRHEALRLALVWIGSDHATSPPVLRWLRAAERRQFPSRVSVPRARSIATLSRRPASVGEGALIAIEGTLGPVEITHRRGGVAVSLASIRDARGDSVAVTTKHRKMDSAGMVEGAYVRVLGAWTHREQNAGGPSLVLVRHRYGDLAETSWTDWVSLQLRPVFEPSPQGLATEWSWQPGADGAGNQLRYGLWSAERRSTRGGM